MAKEASRASMAGIPLADILTAHKVLPTMIENLANDDLQHASHSAPQTRKTVETLEDAQ